MMEEKYKSRSLRSLDWKKLQLWNRIAEMENRIATLESENRRRAEEAIELTNAIRDTQFNIVSFIISNRDSLSRLNKELSVTPVIWGDERRLHISNKAAVFSSLFNLNSGEITIGDYSFAGSNVSFVTGSHDINLTGLLRRDCEIKSGNDIIIGKGVWIASNAMIIGPCEIEDNAVIAAGAVVAPGTKIKNGEVYAGVPAKKVKSINISTDMDIQNKSITDALKREDGILFGDGWSEKKVIIINDIQYIGHFMDDDSAEIITDIKKIELHYKTNQEMMIVVNGSNYYLTEGMGLLEFEALDHNVVVKNNIESSLFLGKVLDE